VTNATTTDGAVADRNVGHGLRVIGVSHHYSTKTGQVHALDNVSVDIKAGEFLAVVGPSGCGKSTLLDILAGLKVPSTGEASVDDRKIIGPSSTRSVVFQNSASLFPWLTVEENVAFGLKLKRVPRNEIARRVAVELDRVGLTDAAHLHPYELSGGMQQRCQIARVLAVDPDVLLLDEPFGAIDALTREILQQHLLDIWRMTHKTVVLITHSVDEAILLGTRVIVMSPRPGRIVHEISAPFANSGANAAEIRKLPEFTAASSELRTLILNDSPSRNSNT